VCIIGLNLVSTILQMKLLSPFITIHSYKSSQTNFLCPIPSMLVPENCFCVQYQVSYFTLSKSEGNMAILQSSMETFRQSKRWWFKIQSRHSELWWMIFNIQWKLWLTAETCIVRIFMWVAEQKLQVYALWSTDRPVMYLSVWHRSQKTLFWFYEGKHWEG
jgi:hypothetical protein